MLSYRLALIARAVQSAALQAVASAVLTIPAFKFHAFDPHIAVFATCQLEVTLLSLTDLTLERFSRFKMLKVGSAFWPVTGEGLSNHPSRRGSCLHLAICTVLQVINLGIDLAEAFHSHN